MAAGGLCGPVSASYGIQGVGAISRPVRDALVPFAADRGGVRFRAPIALADVAAGIGVWTAATDAAPGAATKASVTALCPPTQSVTVDAVTRRIRMGNMMARFDVEAAAANLAVLLVAHARKAEQHLLDGITAASTAVTASRLYGAARESSASVVLSNGSTIRCSPSSERQIRGWSADLLLIDEAAVISDELLAAALPTTAARPQARVVMASSPWADEGPFHSAAMRGFAGDPTVSAFRWKLADCEWISPATVEAARATLSPLRFAAEYEGQFVGSADAYFRREDLLSCVADYPLRRLGDGAEPVVAGLDWGRARDAHAVVLAGLLADYGVNGHPVVVVPWLETSRRPYGEQVAEVVGLAEGWRLGAVVSETNGVGAYPSEELVRLLQP